MAIQYVTDAAGNKLAVLIPLEEWEVISSRLEHYASQVKAGVCVPHVSGPATDKTREGAVELDFHAMTSEMKGEPSSGSK